MIGSYQNEKGRKIKSPPYGRLRSSFKLRIITLLITALVVTAYITMIFTRYDSAKPSWLMIILACFWLSLFYGFYLIRKQIKTGEKTKEDQKNIEDSEFGERDPNLGMRR